MVRVYAVSGAIAPTVLSRKKPTGTWACTGELNGFRLVSQVAGEFSNGHQGLIADATGQIDIALGGVHADLRFGLEAQCAQGQ